jgi:hypothetical protein
MQQSVTAGGSGTVLRRDANDLFHVGQHCSGVVGTLDQAHAQGQGAGSMACSCAKCDTNGLVPASRLSPLTWVCWWPVPSTVVSSRSA